MKKPWLVDTDILIDFLRGYKNAVDFVEKHIDHLLLSVIVIAELYAGIKEHEERIQLDEFISLFKVVPIHAEIAQLGGLLRHQYYKSHGISLADSLIAATAQLHGAELKTLNIKHYPMFKHLHAPYTK